MVHAENHDMLNWMATRLIEDGHTAPRYHAPSRSALAEEVAINRAISLAALVDAPLMIVHVWTPEGREEFTTREFQAVARRLRICSAEMAQSGGFRVKASRVERAINHENIRLQKTGRRIA